MPVKPTFQKQHFEILAAFLRYKLKWRYEEGNNLTYEQVCTLLSTELTFHSPNFNEKHFLTACK